MALTIEKIVQVQEQAPVQAQKPAVAVAMVAQDAGSLLADELINLELKLRGIEYAKIIARQKEIKDLLVGMANANYKSDVPVTFSGTLGDVNLTKCASKTVVKDPLNLFQTLQNKFNLEIAMSCVNWNLTGLAKVLSENELEVFTKKEEGSRSTKIVPKV